MAPRQTETPAALDVGTGSGSWVIDMARLFPHAEIVGLDLVPANLSSPPPGNCRFECDDVNLGLAHYYNSFDVVHFRCAGTGVTKYRQFIDEAALVLRPGGVFLVVDGDMQLYDDKFEKISAEDDVPGFTWTQKMLKEVEAAMTARNPAAFTHHILPKWLKQMDAWEDSGTKYYHVPLGPWEDNMSERDKYIAELMRQDFYRLMESFRPILLAHELPVKVVDTWIKNAKDEMAAMEKRMYIKWHCSWAIKKRPRSDY